MLRIHFTGNDLVRTRLADSPDPLWETVLSLQMLRARYGSVAFDGWRRVVRDALRGTGLADMVRHVLFPVTPDTSYFPDFLTPPEGLLGLDAGIEAVLATPRRRIGHELLRMKFPHGPPSWVTRLAAGERDTLAELGDALGAYHAAALAPHWDRMTTGAEVDHAHRGRLQRAGGTENVLAGFWPMMRWQAPVLEVPYPASMDLHLDGRGLVLIPSYFCWHHPVALADPALPPTLVYPLRPTADFLGLEPTMTTDRPLARLIGSTRACVLGATAQGATTSELARRTGVSMTTVSQHTAVLRESGLIASRRHANAVVHTLTPLGVALLGGTPAPAGSWWPQ
ncbi:MAG: helix-turn-helix domain-containing protein [Streptosporangiales bacterium]|nr:helix-turn-helix domain-containing protein [Streptosporangiales bacterium]